MLFTGTGSGDPATSISLGVYENPGSLRCGSGIPSIQTELIKPCCLQAQGQETLCPLFS